MDRRSFLLAVAGTPVVTALPALPAKTQHLRDLNILYFEALEFLIDNVRSRQGHWHIAVRRFSKDFVQNGWIVPTPQNEWSLARVTPPKCSEWITTQKGKTARYQVDEMFDHMDATCPDSWVELLASDGINRVGVFAIKGRKPRLLGFAHA